VPREARKTAAREEKLRVKNKKTGIDTCFHIPHTTGLIALGLVGMAKAFEEQRQQPAVARSRSRSGWPPRRSRGRRAPSKRPSRGSSLPAFRQNATVEDLNPKAARGLAKALFAKLATATGSGGDTTS